MNKGPPRQQTLEKQKEVQKKVDKMTENKVIQILHGRILQPATPYSKANSH